LYLVAGRISIPADITVDVMHFLGIPVGDWYRDLSMWILLKKGFQPGRIVHQTLREDLKPKMFLIPLAHAQSSRWYVNKLWMYVFS
jgi:hypothetical protein